MDLISTKTKSTYLCHTSLIFCVLDVIADNRHEALLLTTDTKLTFKRAFDIYGIRWNIEVVWKDCKLFLELGSYQGRNLNGQIADCTMAFIAHTMLTLEKRFTEYESMGELYKEVEAQVRMLTLWERILRLLYKVMAMLTAGRETGTGVQRNSSRKRSF